MTVRTRKEGRIGKTVMSFLSLDHGDENQVSNIRTPPSRKREGSFEYPEPVARKRGASYEYPEPPTKKREPSYEYPSPQKQSQTDRALRTKIKKKRQMPYPKRKPLRQESIECSPEPQEGGWLSYDYRK
jgi:hypothetical protein